VRSGHIGISCFCCLACSIVFVVARNQSGDVLASTLSPSGTFRVEITQRRDSRGYERFVYLNASRNGDRFIEDKLLYTGDRLDDDFRNLYPNYSWQSESILKIGRSPSETQANGLRIANETARRINYLLIETYQDKFVVFKVEPRAVVNLRFRFTGQLSCEGQVDATVKRFGSAVRLLDDGERAVSGEFSVRVTDGGVLIESRQLNLRPVTCCAVDRPDMDHERSSQ
jgi:hypothetical protein